MLKILRYSFSMVVFLGGSFLAFIIALFRPFNPKVALLFTKYVPPLAVRALGIDFEIRNQKLMYDNHPCVYIANHQHALDLAAHAAVVCVPTVAIGKKEIKWVPFFGWLFWLTGQMLLDRKNHTSAMESMKEAAQYIHKKNVAVWLFPEGTRSGPRPMQKFKKGAFYLAIQAQVPLLPIVASTYHTNLNLNRWKAGKLIIEVLPPISTQGLTEKDVESLIERSHKIMSDHIAKLDNEILTSHTPH